MITYKDGNYTASVEMVAPDGHRTMVHGTGCTRQDAFDALDEAIDGFPDYKLYVPPTSVLADAPEPVKFVEAQRPPVHVQTTISTPNKHGTTRVIDWFDRPARRRFLRAAVIAMVAGGSFTVRATDG